MLNKLFKLLDSVTENFAVVLYVGFVIIAFLQVIFRYLLNNSLVWSEELCRYLFVWTVFIGASLVIAERKHMRVDIIDNIIPKKVKKYYIVLIDIISFVFFVLLGYSGYETASMNLLQVSPAMSIPMGIIYLSIPLGSFLCIINLIRVVVRDFKAGTYDVIDGGEKIC